MRAKFKLESIRIKDGYQRESPGAERWVPGPVWDLDFTAISGGKEASEEDRSFWDATPSGSIKLTTVNPHAVDGLEVGAPYYVTFERAGKIP